MSEPSTGSYQHVHPATSLLSASNQALPNHKSMVENDFAHSRLAEFSTGSLLDPEFDSKKRLEIAFSFMVLGRKKAAARELANVVKLGTVLEKSQFLRQVGDIFMNFGETETAYQCYREGLLHSKISKDVDITLVTYLKSKMADFENDHTDSSSSVGSIIRSKEKTFRSLISELSVHEKCRQEVDELAQMVADPRMEQRCPFVKNLVENFAAASVLESQLDAFEFNECQDTSMGEFLNLLMLELFKFPDLSLYKNIFSSARLEQVLTYLGLAAPDFELPANFQHLLSILRDSYEVKEPMSKVMESLEFELKKTLLRGCKQYVEKNYEASQETFTRVVIVCDLLSKLCCMTGFKGSDKHALAELDQDCRERLRKVSTISGIYSSLHAAQSFIRRQDSSFDDLATKSVELMALLQNLNKYYLTARYSRLPIKYDWIHLALGKLNEWLAICKSRQFRRDSNSHHDLKKLDDTHLECMLSHYIRALNLKLPDDPCIVTLYDKIIWGVLMHGGYHIQTLWILKFFRDCCVLYSDTCLLSYEEASSYNSDVFKLRDYQDANVQIVVNKLYEQRKQLSKKQGSIFVSSSAKFILPQFFYTSFGELVASQEYTVTPAVSLKQNFKFPGGVMKGILKADPGAVESCNSISEQLLEDWSKGNWTRRNLVSEQILRNFFDSYYDGSKLNAF
ncbi:hypothetical protein KL939_003137 [Ogataea angusta]|nr:hypothetical protein KL939_003137 [Ogataea angusta]